MSERPLAPELRVRLFGGVELSLGERTLPQFPTQKSLSVFICLALNRGRMLHRDVLCGHFWPEHPDRTARKFLRTTLWRIRNTLEPTPQLRGRFIHVNGACVAFRPGDRGWMDALDFEERLDRLTGHPPSELDSEEVDRLKDTLALYRGDLAEGHYDEWCEEERSRLRLRFLSALDRLALHHRDRAEWRKAIPVAGHLLSHDPTREHIHRVLMECHRALGDRPAALRQYDTCARIVSDEFDIEPMEETRRLHEQIRREGDAEGATDSTGEFEMGALAAEVEAALQTLYRVTRRLERARVAMGPSHSGAPFAEGPPDPARPDRALHFRLEDGLSPSGRSSA